MMDLPPFSAVPIQESGEPLVDLSGYGFVLSPEYFRQGLSSQPRMFLRKGVAENLARAQEGFAGKYRFKIWDAYRSREAQKRLFDRFANELRRDHPEWDEETLIRYATRYVNLGSDERIIPPHSTGGTVDITLVGADTEELDMGTAFDHFGEEAASDHFEADTADPVISGNRKILKDTMQKAGFIHYEHEWWHFEYGTQRWALETGKPHALYGGTAPNEAQVKEA